MRQTETRSEKKVVQENSRTHIFCRQEGRCLGKHHDIEGQTNDRKNATAKFASIKIFVQETGRWMR